MSHAETPAAAIALTQAEIETITTFKSVTAKDASKHAGHEELTKVLLTLGTERWELRGTDRYVAAYFSQGYAKDLDEKSAGISVLLGKPELDVIKENVITVTPSQRKVNDVDVEFTLSENERTYAITFTNADGDSTTVEADNATEDGSYPAIDRLFPTETDETESFPFDHTALSKITDIVLPHEVGIQKSSRENTLRFDFSAPSKYSSARIVLIRRLARNWPEDQTFKAILMGSIDSVLIPSA